MIGEVFATAIAGAAVQVCPQAYEIFGPTERMPELRRVVASSGAKITSTQVEPGDVARFTAFVPDAGMGFPQGLLKLQELPALVSAKGGTASASLAKPPGSSCSDPHWRKLTTPFLPKVTFFEVTGVGVSRMRDDLAALKLESIAFVAAVERVIFRFEASTGLYDPKVQSIAYRAQRGDYGGIVVGSGMSLTEIKNMAPGQAGK